MKPKLTQREMILMHLQDYGSISALEALQNYAIMRLASRIADLRKEGYNIISETKKTQNRFGDTIYHAVYHLESKGE